VFQGQRIYSAALATSRTSANVPIRGVENPIPLQLLENKPIYFVSIAKKMATNYFILYVLP